MPASRRDLVGMGQSKVLRLCWMLLVASTGLVAFRTMTKGQRTTSNTVPVNTEAAKKVLPEATKQPPHAAPEKPPLGDMPSVAAAVAPSLCAVGAAAAHFDLSYEAPRYFPFPPFRNVMETTHGTCDLGGVQLGCGLRSIRTALPLHVHG